MAGTGGVGVCADCGTHGHYRRDSAPLATAVSVARSNVLFHLFVERETSHNWCTGVFLDHSNMCLIHSNSLRKQQLQSSEKLILDCTLL